MRRDVIQYITNRKQVNFPICLRSFPNEVICYVYAAYDESFSLTAFVNALRAKRQNILRWVFPIDFIEMNDLMLILHCRDPISSKSSHQLQQMSLSIDLLKFVCMAY